MLTSYVVAAITASAIASEINEEIPTMDLGTGYSTTENTYFSTEDYLNTFDDSAVATSQTGYYPPTSYNNYSYRPKPRVVIYDRHTPHATTEESEYEPLYGHGYYPYINESSSLEPSGYITYHDPSSYAEAYSSHTSGYINGYGYPSDSHHSSYSSESHHGYHHGYSSDSHHGYSSESHYGYYSEPHHGYSSESHHYTVHSGNPTDTEGTDPNGDPPTNMNTDDSHMTH